MLGILMAFTLVSSFSIMVEGQQRYSFYRNVVGLGVNIVGNLLAIPRFAALGAALAVLPVSFRGGSARLRKKRGNLLMLAGAVVFGGGLGPVLLLL